MNAIPIRALLAGALLAASALPASAAETMKVQAAPQNVTMGAQNGSGETGSTTLRDTANGLVVTIHIKNAKGPQPAHIHKGSCAKLDPKPEYPLHNVVNGMSVTTVKGVTIGELKGKSAINVHKSLKDLKTYVSCGDVGTASAM